MRLIDADKLNKKKKYSFQTMFGAFPKYEWFIKADDLFRAPTVDAVPVVRCEKCVLHGNCTTEDTFVLAGIENPFCCVGKTKEGAYR